MKKLNKGHLLSWLQDCRLGTYTTAIILKVEDKINSGAFDVDYCEHCSPKVVQEEQPDRLDSIEQRLRRLETICSISNTQHSTKLE